MSNCEASLNRLYELLALQEANCGGKRRLAQCDGYMNWPKRGVYFFFEDGELRTDAVTPRVVRAGTHALKPSKRCVEDGYGFGHLFVGDEGLLAAQCQVEAITEDRSFDSTLDPRSWQPATGQTRYEKHGGTNRQPRSMSDRTNTRSNSKSATTSDRCRSFGLKSTTHPDMKVIEE